MWWKFELETNSSCLLARQHCASWSINQLKPTTSQYQIDEDLNGVIGAERENVDLKRAKLKNFAAVNKLWWQLDFGSFLAWF